MVALKISPPIRRSIVLTRSRQTTDNTSVRNQAGLRLHSPNTPPFSIPNPIDSDKPLTSIDLIAELQLSPQQKEALGWAFMYEKEKAGHTLSSDEQYYRLYPAKLMYKMGTASPPPERHYFGPYPGGYVS